MLTGSRSPSCRNQGPFHRMYGLNFLSCVVAVSLAGPQTSPSSEKPCRGRLTIFLDVTNPSRGFDRRLFLVLKLKIPKSGPNVGAPCGFCRTSP
ncbi:hypothetical protein C8R46DRAFT_1067487 [Mycena filopes]|nr:hypothetical protein C8R46DRAFT_1067487 [Mycena filopes]